MNEILKYFPHLSEEQQRQFASLFDLYADWNAKINVISRKDIDYLYEHHVLHSLAIAKYIRFKDDTNVLDFGTGGGFPGIPLAIMFPNVNFKLIDGTGKKIKVATEVANAIGLKNVMLEHLRGEDERGHFDFIVSRAVMPLPDMVRLMRKNISRTQHNALPNGFITLKGGDVTEEVKPFKRIANILPLSEWFEEKWFVGKNIIYIPC
ncbi:MAG: 16S rRNA (guanine(527)-N(7))-methyltransferase RsmG [Prevotella sp.]|jgi:16S rRNA (guanine527-N7)-methyltransferase